MKKISLLLLIIVLGCKEAGQEEDHKASIEDNPYPIADYFVEPVPEYYYDAQPFGENNHLGEDWNGPHGGNTDLGEPFKCIGNGVVVLAEDIGSGWGNVIIVRHTLPDETQIESLYGHADEIYVKPGDVVSIGQTIGTIGNVGGIYYAHLHFEIRTAINKGVGGGYSSNTDGYINPRDFYKKYN